MTAVAAVKLVSNLKKFNEAGVLSQSLIARLLRKGTDALEKFFLSRHFKLHKLCYDNFNDTKLKRAKLKKKSDDLIKKSVLYSYIF